MASINRPLGHERPAEESAGVGENLKKRKGREKIMKHYLENHKFYVINEENLVYKVGEFETYGNADFITWELELVAGLDYVNPDESDIQDWVEADNFVDDVQYEYVNQLFLVEGAKEALEYHDYKILEEIDFNLQAIIDKHNEA